MRILPRMALSLLLASGVGACAEPDRPSRTTGDSAVGVVRQPPEPGTQPELSGVVVEQRMEAGADSVITISVNDGAILVSPEDAYIRRGQSVRWKSSPTDTAWVVAFPGATPFQNGRRVFNGGGPGQANTGGPLLNTPGLGSHKYSVFWPDGSGGYTQLDPKLVIVDETGDTTRMGGM